MVAGRGVAGWRSMDAEVDGRFRGGAVGYRLGAPPSDAAGMAGARPPGAARLARPAASEGPAR